MDNLDKKLKELKELLEKGMNNAGIGGTGSVKAGKVLPSTSKLPKPGHNSLAGKVKIPNITPISQKDPIKSIEQTQNKDIKDLKMKEAQAHFSKDEDGPRTRPINEGSLYHIHQGSLRITSKPLSLKEINDKHSGVKAVEAAGYRIVPHKEQLTVKKNGQWELNDLEKSDNEPKSEAKPAHQGTYPGQVHERVTERGHRLVKFPKQNPDGSVEYGVRKIPNKVKIVHSWDHDKKEWNHKETTNVTNSEKTPVARNSTDNAKSPMDIARAKAAAAAKDAPKVESKVKTIRRKLEDIKKSIEEMEKSGYKGYTPEDNAKRKANNIDDTEIKSMPRVKAYGGSGVDAAGKEAAKMKAKSKKNPVKVYTREEIAALQDKKD